MRRQITQLDFDNIKNLSTNDLLNRKKVPKDASKREADYEYKQLIELKIRIRKKKNLSPDEVAFLNRSTPAAVNYESWKDKSPFSDSLEKTMRANVKDHLLKAAKIDVYGKSGLTDSHVDSINTMTKRLGESKLISAFVKSGKSVVNKQIVKYVLAQAILHIGSLTTGSNSEIINSSSQPSIDKINFMYSVDIFLTRLFSFDSVIQEDDLPPLFFCEAVFAVFKLDTPVCNEFNLTELYTNNGDIKYRTLLWRLFQAEALYASFSRFALTMAEGSGFSAKLVDVVDKSRRTVYKLIPSPKGKYYGWIAAWIIEPQVSHVEFQGKDAPNLRVIINSLLLNVNNQAQILLDYDSVLINAINDKRNFINTFMRGNYEKEVKLIFTSFDRLFNAANKMGLLMDDINVVTLELESCLAQIEAINYDSVNAILSDHKYSIAAMIKEQDTAFQKFEDTGSSFINVITVYANKIAKLIADNSTSLYISSIHSKMAISEMYREKEGYKKNSKRVYDGLMKYFKAPRKTKSMIMNTTTSTVLGFMIGKIVDVSSRRRVSMKEAKKISSNSNKNIAVYSNIALGLRQELNELKLYERGYDE